MPIYTDVDNGVFEFESYGKCVFRPTYDWDAGKRTDIIVFNESSDTTELTKDLRFGTHITPENKNVITGLIKNTGIASVQRVVIGQSLVTNLQLIPELILLCDVGNHHMGFMKLK